MKSSNNVPTGSSPKQWVVIAVIVVLAAVAGVAIMRSGKSGQDVDPAKVAKAQRDSHAHDEHDADAKTAGKDGGDHKDADGHVESSAEHEDEHGHDVKSKAAKSEAEKSAAVADNSSTAGEKQAAAPRKEAEHNEKVEFSKEQIATSGIEIETAGPAEVAGSVQLPGEIRFNEDRTAHVVPRVAGVVESVSVNLGQQVRKGQVLAVLASVGVSEQRSELLAAQKRLALAKVTADRERRLFEDKISAQQDFLQAEQAQREAEIAVSNASQKLQAIGATGGSGTLARYELRAPFDGMVVEKHLSLGESVREDAQVFTISDLSSVWAQINVNAANLNLVRVGEVTTIRASGFEQSATGKISYVGSLLGEQTRTAVARVTLPNPNLAWRPGLFVTVELVSGKSNAPVTVSAEAIQTIEERPSVFVQVNGGFEARAVRIGRSDGKRVEIVSGLEAGTTLAGKNSYVVKAQKGKGSAGHEH
ncbi:MAG: efflux RND transporter periplasmic adaptor subunit [Curvibacter sp.]|jgi:cobalt-zinc-cadmium efflux system membrane fusion protein|uniref:efflux RND transporter periplasmic adaptor subunit n=1 Tax=Curvibacter lanceolatus TaxID=86182 RepID=UPI000365EC0A|nr:efflux RND transporter periplasmic adaptor subunit [Curvibacter lanceolatus]RUP34945.1 MAG: efflux RND transporter periplasmic adaptor subunit [Curvibacter sp.]